MNNHIVGLDIGSSTIKAVVGEIKRDGEISLVSFFQLPSSGMRKGIVYDLSVLTQSLSPVLSAIKNISKSAISNIFLSLGSSDLKVHTSIGVVAVSRADYEIYEDDIQRAVASAQAINIPLNRMILHSVVKEFVVDGVRDIRDPLGMVGNRLEVNSLIIDAFAPSVKNLSKGVEILGGGLGGLILSPLGAARAVLSRNQKELGVALIDIGFGKTSLCVYEESKLMHAAVFPIGSGNITNDLAIGLKIPIETAEIIKLSFGSAFAREVGARDTVDLSKINPNLKGAVSKKFIADIIEVRLAEIFELVDNELKRMDLSKNLPAGVVLTGGGVKIPGIVELSKHCLKLSTQIGSVDTANFRIDSEEMRDKLDDPEFVTTLGLLLWGYDKLHESKKIKLPLRGLLKKIVNYFTP